MASDDTRGRSANLTMPIPAMRFNSPPLAQPSSPEYTPPPLNEREVKVIGALAKLGITGQRAQLEFTSASIWANFGAGSHLFVFAHQLRSVDRGYTVLDERRVAGILVQHVTFPSSDTIRSQFECSADEYWIFGAVPPGFTSLDAFVERFISVLGCSP